MSEDEPETRMVLIDASVFITLAEIDLVEPLLALDGTLVVPRAVANEITTGPATSALSSAQDSGAIRTEDATAELEDAAEYLGRDASRTDPEESDHQPIEGDVALLALALQYRRTAPSRPPVVVTDDKPLRNTCKTLSVPVSGSIGVLVRAVERGEIDPVTATEKLYAMDEVGARLSASLVRRAERLIDEAAEK